MELTLERITSGSRLIPFTEHELRAAMENVKLRRSKGTDLSIGHPRFCPDAQSTVDAANEGIIFLHSPVLLETCFAFTKADAGRGFFGGQKAVFPTYVSDDLYLDSWTPGSTFKSWVIALTSIGNVYRGNGFA